MNAQITILMAIYKPNIKWLEEQLISLNEQTYGNLKLLVWNDCPTDTTDYESICRRYITNFPYRIFSGDKNLGSNGAFGELTRLADSEYVAYCDQDDVWLPEKLSTLMDIAEQSGVELLCSDMYVIDADGEIQSDSAAKFRSRNILYDGEEQFIRLITRNFVAGCTTLVRTDFAKRVLPFPQEFVHDWWLAWHAVVDNSIRIVHQPLIKYRIHGNNQTTILAGVTDKASYREKRIKLMAARLQLVEQHFGATRPREMAIFRSYIAARLAWSERVTWHNFWEFFRWRAIDKSTVYFELVFPFMTEGLFSFALGLIRRGTI